MDMGPLRSQGEPEGLKYYAMSTPGATTISLNTNLNKSTSRLQPKDYLVIISGTNDIKMLKSKQLKEEKDTIWEKIVCARMDMIS